eukprot:8679844-Alexandrium_andersonii.AAC.1
MSQGGMSAPSSAAPETPTPTAAPAPSPVVRSTGRSIAPATQLGSEVELEFGTQPPYNDTGAEAETKALEAEIDQLLSQMDDDGDGGGDGDDGHCID